MTGSAYPVMHASPVIGLKNKSLIVTFGKVKPDNTDRTMFELLKYLTTRGQRNLHLIEE